MTVPQQRSLSLSRIITRLSVNGVRLTKESVSNLYHQVSNQEYHSGYQALLGEGGGWEPRMGFLFDSKIDFHKTLLNSVSQQRAKYKQMHVLLKCHNNSSFLFCLDYGGFGWKRIIKMCLTRCQIKACILIIHLILTWCNFTFSPAVNSKIGGCYINDSHTPIIEKMIRGMRPKINEYLSAA